MRRGSYVGAALVLVAGLAPVVTAGGPPALAASRAAMPFDFDGDGFADLTIGVPSEDIGSRQAAGAVQVLYGSASGPTARDQLWHQNRKGIKGVAHAREAFGDAIASGDFDSDGFADLAIGVPWNSVGGEGAGAVQVLFGGSGGLTARDQLWHQNSAGVPGSNEGGDQFGRALAAGDFDNDGYVDLAIGAPGEYFDAAPYVTGRVVVLRGSASGLTAAGVQSWSLLTAGMNRSSVPPPDLAGIFGSALAAGDVNGDGRADLVVCAGGEWTTLGEAVGAIHLLYGSAGGLTITGNQYLPAEDIGYRVAEGGLADMAMGDFNKDGRADLVVGDGSDSETGSTEKLVVVYASPDGLVASSAQPWILDRNRDPQEGDTWDQDSFATGDLSGDGIDDLAVGADGMALGGSVHMLAGSATGLVGPWTVITQDTPGVPGKSERGDNFGAHVAILPLAGGSTGWLVVGSPGEDLGAGGGNEGRVVVIPSGSGGLNPSAARAWHQDSVGIKGAAEIGDLFGRTVGIGQHSSHLANH